MNRYYYAAHNRGDDPANGIKGPPSAWTITRYERAKDRDEFVRKHRHQRARAVTRPMAQRLYRDTFECRGELPPVGGLFYQKIDRFQT